MSPARIHRLPEPAYRRAPEEKRALLLEAALELFATQGFEGTTTVEIARKAGVSEGTLFNHFGSKRGLFAKLAENYGREVAASVLPEDAEELSYEIIVRSAFDFAERDPAQYRLFVMDAPKFEGFDVTSASDVILSVVETQLRAEIEAGAVRPCDPRVVGELQLAIVLAAYAGWSRTGDPTLLDTYVEEAVRSLEGMLAPNESMEHDD